MNDLWLRNPSIAYAMWQDRERSEMTRGFAPQSVVQHQAMVDRFNRHLVAHGVTLADFESHHIDAFWLDADAATYAPGTRTRYLKLLDRLCRHLVEIGVRGSNPAAHLASRASWPSQGPVPLFLPEEIDQRLQDFVANGPTESVSALRTRAIVAVFLGTGITAREGRIATLEQLHASGDFPHLHVEPSDGKPGRRIPLETFATPVLQAWKARREQLPIRGDLLFALRASGTPITDMSLGNIVREAFKAIGYEADDMSPRILRNTYCRRLLIAGTSRETVSALLGLASTHTCDRMLATIGDKGRGVLVR